jgi:hypothetical protein
VLAPSNPVQALSDDLVISQAYGGGGSAGAPYRNDYVELFNRGAETVSLNGMSVQYAGATGTGTFESNPLALPPVEPPPGTAVGQAARKPAPDPRSGSRSVARPC